MNVSVELIVPRKGKAEQVVREMCALAKHLEQSGRYEEAGSVLAPYWSKIGAVPEVGELKPFEAAKVLLRSGVISGFLGNRKQIANSQDYAKDLISEAIRKFQETGSKVEEAEGHTELAQCFLRLGELDNGRVHINEALELLSDFDLVQRAHAVLVLSMIEALGRRLHDALSLLLQSSQLFSQIENDSLKGRYHMTLANVFNELGELDSRTDYIDRALIEYSAASYHLEQIGHHSFCASVESNHGNALQSLGRFAEAEEHLILARRKLTALNDIGTVAIVEETIARGKLAQKQYKEAAEVASNSVRLLRSGEAPTRLAESLTTLGVALARSGEEEQARTALDEAVYVAELAGNLEVAGRASLAILEEFDLDFQSRCELHLKTLDLLGEMQDLSISRRMRGCATRVVNMALEEVNTPERKVNKEIELGGGISLPDEVRKFEERLIVKAMSQTDGRISHAARLLGISHQSLDNKLNRQFKNVRFIQTHRHRDSLNREKGSSFPNYEDVQLFTILDESLSYHNVHTGDRLIVARQAAQIGDPVVISYNGEILAGMYYRENGAIRLEADGEGFDDRYIEDSEAFTIEGVIVAYVKAKEDLNDDPAVVTF